MTMETDSYRSLASLVAESPTRAKVFEKFGLDYCCGGKQSLLDACGDKQIDVAIVLGELAQHTERSRHSAGAAAHAQAADTMTQITEHIENSHHNYMRIEMPRILQLAKKVATRHGEANPRLVQLAESFELFADRMSVHMMKEETVLFPMLRQLDTVTDHLPVFHCGSVANPIRVMEFEHEDAGESLSRFRALTDDYKLPDNACTTYRALFAALQEMESDLHMHVHEENNVLFPKALKREVSLSG